MCGTRHILLLAGKLRRRKLKPRHQVKLIAVKKTHQKETNLQENQRKSSYKINDQVKPISSLFAGEG
jgi:hypothetical protein